ncbi:shikimate kinase [Haloarchaeobius sp. DFWS5]|uniref:shikimate kinase n=1 Tax=Haloarchaeobius sp. DFWS5 TaxID=3446114 RepID=UPI003EB836FE
MDGHGRATAPAAGTVLNALATHHGSAFAIDLETTATVDLDDSGEFDGDVAGHPDADTRLVARCAELAVERWGDESAATDTAAIGAHVTTEGEIPMAAGLKSSSAAANATVVATCDALSVDPDPLDACRVGVQAARDTGVTVTGAFDDASASMLGGVVVTDNDRDELLAHEELDSHALVWWPNQQAFSADADTARCERIAPMARLVEELALDGRYGEAMTVNGFAYCAALGFPTDPLVEALPDVTGVSLSGTGPSFVALGERDALESLADRWNTREGTTWLTTTRQTGCRTT